MNNVVGFVLSRLWQKGDERLLSCPEQHIRYLKHILVDLCLIIQKRCDVIAECRSCLFNDLLKRWRGVIDNLFAATHQFSDQGQRGVCMTMRRNVKEQNFRHDIFSRYQSVQHPIWGTLRAKHCAQALYPLCDELLASTVRPVE